VWVFWGGLFLGGCTCIQKNPLGFWGTQKTPLGFLGTYPGVWTLVTGGLNAGCLPSADFRLEGKLSSQSCVGKF